MFVSLQPHLSNQTRNYYEQILIGNYGSNVHYYGVRTKSKKS